MNRCYEEHEEANLIWKEGDPIDSEVLFIAENYAIIRAWNVQLGEEHGIAYDGDKHIDWIHSNERAPKDSTSFTITIDGLKPGKTYYYCTYSQKRDLDPSSVKLGKVKTFTTKTRAHPVMEAVDLGLSVKWASCNIGAASPEEFGAFYQFGESYEKDYYYAHPSSLSHVNLVRGLGKEGWNFPNRIWGNNWRTPTKIEYNELIKKCTWEWTQINEVNGYKITAKNGNSIFLPASGSQYGRKVSFRNIGGVYPALDDEYSLGFTKKEIGDFGRLSTSNGYVVRPVCK